MKDDFKSYLNSTIFKRSFGGLLGGKSHAKYKRPLSTQSPMLIAFKSSYAHGNQSFLQNRYRKPILKKAKYLCHKFDIQFRNLQFSNQVLTLEIKGVNRKGVQNFLRSFSGIVARMILKAEKMQPSNILQFWDFRPLTSIIQTKNSWDFINTKDELNALYLFGLGFDLRYFNTC